jgi:hypothetical protein
MQGVIIEKLMSGIHISEYTVYVHGVTRGRFTEESDFDIFLSNGQLEAHALYAKIFKGRKPWYRPWIELFGIETHIALNHKAVPYLNSALEDTVLTTVTSALDAGEHLFVDYHNDSETRTQLAAGLPAVLTRLGNKLYRLGFTWFKDWYFPEGYMEGEQKLQAEKPLDDDSRNRHLREIRSAVESFLDSSRSYARSDPHYERIVRRAEELVDKRQADSCTNA